MKITKLLHPRIKRVYRLGRDDKDHKPVYIEVPVFGGEFDTLVDALAAAGPIGAAWLPGICPYDTDLKTPDRVWLCQPPFTWIEAPGVAAQYNAWKVEIGDRDRQEFGDEIEGWHEIIAAEDRINHRRYKQSTRDM